MAVLYRVVERGAQTTFVCEGEGGITGSHALLTQAAAIAEDKKEGFAAALVLAAAERNATLRRAWADEAAALNHGLGRGGTIEQRITIDLDCGRIRVEYDHQAGSLRESLDALEKHFLTTASERVKNRLVSFLAEHDGSKELYKTLHDELELTNQEIEAMGFKLAHRYEPDREEIYQVVLDYIQFEIEEYIRSEQETTEIWPWLTSGDEMLAHKETLREIAGRLDTVGEWDTGSIHDELTEVFGLNPVLEKEQGSELKM